VYCAIEKSACKEYVLLTVNCVFAVFCKKIILHHWNCEQGMKQLEIQVIDIIPDPQHTADEEEKISSSSARKRLLGTLLRPPLKVSHDATGCILICFTCATLC